MKSNKEQAYQVDNRLYAAAAYAESKGLMTTPDPNKIIERFAQYKLRLRKGTFTIEQLEDHVYAKFGPFKEKDIKKFLTPEAIGDITLDNEQSK